MSITFVTRTAGATGSLALFVVFACSTAPPSAPDAAAMASAATTETGATLATASDAGDPDPLEALHDAVPVPIDKPETLRPHALKVVLDEENTVFGNVGPTPYLSEDGTVAIGLEDRSSVEAKRAQIVLLIWELDHPERDREMMVVDSPDCRVSPHPPPCDRLGAEVTARNVNAFLAKHRWVEVREFWPWAPRFDGNYCDRTLRVRAADHYLEFRSPHLRVIAPGGALIVDRSDVTPPPAPGAPATCPPAQRAFVSTVGIDLARRAMYVLFGACKPPECPGSARYLFFRLPKPSK